MHRLLATINVLLAISLIAWPLALFFAIFLFDSPASRGDPILLVFATTILAYPAPIVLGNIMFWSKRKTATSSTLRNWTLVSCASQVSFLLMGVLNFSR